MIVRELITRLGYQVDRKSEAKGKASFEKLRSAASSLGAFLATGALAVGFKKTLDAASDVEETMNVVSTAFEDQAQSVLEWARTSGDAAGRSQYAMREYAATIGAVVGPTLGSAEATADLSTQMAQLAVDLGSFFNASDEDALNALRSGLIGQSEPLLQFGVNMNVAALDAFALSEGLGKTTKQMSQQEKTMLRFRYIMSQTTKAQGDAAKTSDGFANQMKRLEGNFNELAVGIGKQALPSAAGFLQTLNGLVKVMIGPLSLAFKSVLNAIRFVGILVRGLWEGFKSLGAGMKIALAIGLVALLAFLAPWALFYPLVAAAVTGAILILEDLWKTITTGGGVIGGFVDELNFQLANTESWSAAMGEIFQTAIDFWGELFFGFGDTTEQIGLWLVDIFDRIGAGIDAAISFVGDLIDSAITAWIDSFGLLGDKAGEIFRDLIVLFTDIKNAVADFFTGGIERALDLAGKFFGVVGDLDKAAGLVGPSRITVPGSPAARAAAGNVEANQQINVNVNAPGADGQAIAATVAPAVGRAAADGNRQIGQQLLAGGATP